MPKQCVCASCGKDFETIHVERNVKFCSSKCFGLSMKGVKKNEEFARKLSEAMLRRPTKYPKSFLCRTCGVSFKPKRRPSIGREKPIYCSRACSHGDMREAAVTRRYRQYTHGANVRGYKFQLSMYQFLKFWNVPCHYCGDEIRGIGLDRVDPKGDYHYDNVVPCCIICNKMKSGMELSVFLGKIKKIAVKYGSS